MSGSAFIGQEAAWREWMDALGSDRLHHAWLLAGAKGLGKEAFARAAAAALVRGEGDAVDPDVHPDIHVLTHLPANSRCRVLRFAALSAQDLDAVIRRDYPEASAALRESAIAGAQGSPGLALAFVEHDLGEIHALMQRVLQDGDGDLSLRGMLTDAMGARPARERQLAVLELARAVLAAELPRAAPSRQSAVIEAHGALVRLGAQAPTYNFDPGLLILEIGGLLASAARPREPARQA